MTDAFNVGGVNSDSGFGNQAGGGNLTIPVGVAIDDQMLVYAEFFTWGGGTITNIICTATSGHTWTKLGAIQSSGVDGFSNLVCTAVVYTRKATSGDAGDILNFHHVGTPGSADQEWWACAFGSYSGFVGGFQVRAQEGDVNQSATPYPYPSSTTTQNGSWAMYAGIGAPNGGGSTSGPPSGCTQRAHRNNSGVDAILVDTGGSVGSSGTAIGGSTAQQPWTGSGTPAWWRTMFTIEGITASLGVTGTGSIRMHKMGLSATGHAPVVGTGSIAMHKMGISGHGTIPGAAHMQMHKMGISATGHAPLFASGTIHMHKMGVSASGAAGMSVVFNHTDGNGVDYYDVTSIYNGPSSTVLRVLDPVSPAAGYSHQFLYTLAVEAYPGTTFGNGLDHVRTLGGHDSYNLTVVEASFPIDPWFADSSDDPNRRYESFMVRLVEWVKAHLATTGLEEHVLIGFSKSGIGGQGLIMNNPTVFDKCISWDYPADMDNISRFDPDSTANYGTDEALFDARYNLSSTNLARWKTPFLTQNRLHISAGQSFTAEVDDHATRLTAKSMLYTNPANVTRSHNWTSGWVAPALASVFTPSTTGTGSIRMHKMGMSATGHAPLVGTGTIRMHKMGMSGAGSVKVRGTGTIRMHKMRIKTPNFQSHIATSMFVFTDV